MPLGRNFPFEMIINLEMLCFAHEAAKLSIHSYFRFGSRTLFYFDVENAIPKKLIRKRKYMKCLLPNTLHSYGKWTIFVAWLL